MLSNGGRPGGQQPLPPNSAAPQQHQSSQQQQQQVMGLAQQQQGLGTAPGPQSLGAPTVGQPGLGGAGQPRQPGGQTIKYMEVLPAQLQRLRLRLREKSFKGSNNVHCWTLELLEKVQQPDQGYTFTELVNTVQANEEELREGQFDGWRSSFRRSSPFVAGLKSCEAVRVDGEWFSLDPDYHMKVVRFMFRWSIACM